MLLESSGWRPEMLLNIILDYSPMKKGDTLNGQSCWFLVFPLSRWFRMWPCSQLCSLHGLINEDRLPVPLSSFLSCPTCWLAFLTTLLPTALLWQGKKIQLNQFSLLVPAPQNWGSGLKNGLGE